MKPNSYDAILFKYVKMTLSNISEFAKHTKVEKKNITIINTSRNNY